MTLELKTPARDYCAGKGMAREGETAQRPPSGACRKSVSYSND